MAAVDDPARRLKMKWTYLLLTTCAMLILTAAVLGRTGWFSHAHNRNHTVTVTSATDVPWHFRHAQPRHWRYVMFNH
jgi:hypothetical protein